jgi:hypothetical protein
MGKKVKCISVVNATGNSGVKLDEIYEVEQEYGGMYYLKGVGGAYYTYRFHDAADDWKAVEEAMNAGLRMAADLHNASIAKNADPDPEETRCWEALKPRIEPGYCKCGILRQMCDYHRD